MFPWLSVAFISAFRAGVGQHHPVFQADVTPTIEWVEGEHRKIWKGGGVVIICAYEESRSSLGTSSWQLL